MTQPRPIQVAVVAPVLPLRLGLRTLLQESGDFTILSEASSLAELDFTGDIDVILTTENPNRAGFLFPAGPAAPAFLLLTNDPGSARLLVDWQAAVWGVLPLDTSADELAAAVQALATGLWVADSAFVQRFLTFPPVNPPDDLPGDEALTSRELEVLQGLSQGLANKQIGLALGISEHTVKFHVSAIYSKLGASNRTEAVRLGVQRGLVTL